MRGGLPPGLLLAAAAALLAVPSAPAAGPDEFRSEEYRFVLRSPGPGWRLLRGPSLRTVSAAAVAGARTTGGIQGVVFVEYAGTLDPRRFAAAAARNVHLQDPAISEPRLVRVAGVAGAAADAAGTVRGVPAVFRVVALPRPPWMVRIVLLAHEADGAAREAAFAEFLAALSFLEGEIRPPPFAPSPDMDGPGWRVRRGAFESAPFRFRWEPPPGWRLLVGQELRLADREAEAGLLCRVPEVLLFLRPEAAPGLTEEGLGAEQAAELRSAEQAVRGAPPLAASLDGVPLRLVLHRDPSGFPQAWFAGAALADGIAWRVLARCPAGLEGEAAKALPAALGSIRFLRGKALADLEASLRAAPDRRGGITGDGSLREGFYRDFPRGVSLRLPGERWRARVGPAAAVRYRGAALLLQEPTLGLEGTLLYAEPGETEEGPAFHARIVAWAAEGKARPSRREPWPAAGPSGFVSLFEGGEGAEPRLLAVATALRGSTGAVFCFRARPAAGKAAAAAADAALAGFRFETYHQATVIRGRLFTDLRAGFLVEAPPGPAEGTDIVPAALEGAGVGRTWAGEGFTLTVLAFYAPEGAPDLGEVAADQLRALPGSDRVPLDEPPVASRALLAGRPCTAFRWTGPTAIVEVRPLVRGGLLYTVAASAPAGTPWEALEGAFDRFRLLD